MARVSWRLRARCLRALGFSSGSLPGRAAAVRLLLGGLVLGALVYPAVALANVQNQTLPALSGTFQSGQVVSTTTGTWTGSGTISYAYQWQRCDAYSPAVMIDPTSNRYFLTSTAAINDGNWHLIDATFAGTSLKLYVDAGTPATMTTAGSLQYSSLPVELGRFDSTFGNYLAGSVDEAAV